MVRHELLFSQQYSYDPHVGGIQVPVVLRAGASRVDVLANVDTGASYCLFGREAGETLAIPIESGERATFLTANSKFDAYGHELSMSVLGIDLTAMVSFFADPTIRKNVLGRRGWLNRVRLGLIDHDCSLYVNRYDE